jgi:hypothetical protein
MHVAVMELQRTRVVATQQGPQLPLVARHQKQAPQSLRGLLQPEVHNIYREAVRKGEVSATYFTTFLMIQAAKRRTFGSCCSIHGRFPCNNILLAHASQRIASRHSLHHVSIFITSFATGSVLGATQTVTSSIEPNSATLANDQGLANLQRTSSYPLVHTELYTLCLKAMLRKSSQCGCCKIHRIQTPVKPMTSATTAVQVQHEVRLSTFPLFGAGAPPRSHQTLYSSALGMIGHSYSY